MHKNKIVLASLVGLFSLNAAASAWIPSKDNALVYAVGGLAVVSGVLAYKVCQLTKHVAASDEARAKLGREMKNKAEASNIPNVAALTKQIEDMQNALNALKASKNESTPVDITHLATKQNMANDLTNLSISLTNLFDARLKALKDAFTAATLESGAQLTGGFNTLLEKTKEEIHQSTNAAIEIQRQAIVEQVTKALDAHKKAFTEDLKKLDNELTNVLATNDVARQKGIIEIQQKLKTFVLLENLEQALQPIKDATDKAKTDATLAKSEAEKATRLSQSAKDEVRNLLDRVTDLAKNITTNATAKADAEKPSAASIDNVQTAPAAATPAAAPANA